MKQVFNKFDCFVSDTDQIYISIHFGIGQHGTSSLKKFGVQPVSGKMENEYLGRGSVLNGSEIRITSLAQLSDHAPGIASITLVLSTAYKTRRSFSTTLAQGEETVEFVTTVRFMKQAE
jgi:hypothetical protein